MNTAKLRRLKIAKAVQYLLAFLTAQLGQLFEDFGFTHG